MTVDRPLKKDGAAPCFVFGGLPVAMVLFAAFVNTRMRIEEQYEADRAAEEAARNFSVEVRNTNISRSLYIVILKEATLSERIGDLQPGIGWALAATSGR